MNIEENFFSPLDKRYCNYFYFLTIFSFIILVYILSVILYTLFMSNDKNKSNMIYNMFLSFLTVFITYFQNRLFYSMCAAPLRS